MKNIIILNLGSQKDIIESSYLTSSIVSEHPDHKIEMLVDSANAEIAEIVSGVHKVHTIDTTKIKQIFDTPLYSEAFAINEFVDSLDEIFTKNWDYAYNYSNDSVSSYLISAVDSHQKIGTYISNNGVARTTNKWATYQNAVAPMQARPVIDRVNMRNHIAGTPVYHEEQRIKMNGEYTAVATQNFARIRQMKGSSATFIVGINLNEGSDGYVMGSNTYMELLEAIEESENFKAVLLLDGKSYQRETVNELNAKFKDTLISINVETVALPAVLSNLDILVSTSNTQLAIADAMETKCIEIRDFTSKNFIPVCHTNDNYIIQSKDESNMANDIILAINEELETELPITTLSSANPTYKLIQDEYGVTQSQIRGELDLFSELSFHLERSITLENLGYPHNAELVEHVKLNSDDTQLSTFVNEMKEELTDTVKVLLSTLRSLKGMKNSEGNLNSFISHLDTLIAIGRNDTIIASTVRFFEGRIENIEAVDMDANIKAIESNLFQLKSELQTITTLLTELSVRSDKSSSAQVRNTTAEA